MSATAELIATAADLWPANGAAPGGPLDALVHASNLLGADRAVSNLGGTGPYVGWITIDPTITFHFANVISYQTISVHVDNSGFGGVAEPSAIVRQQRSRASSRVEATSPIRTISAASSTERSIRSGGPWPRRHWTHSAISTALPTARPSGWCASTAS